VLQYFGRGGAAVAGGWWRVAGDLEAKRRRDEETKRLRAGARHGERGRREVKPGAKEGTAGGREGRGGGNRIKSFCAEHSRDLMGGRW
jgi:hypothetical protein